jgi:elongation factor 1-beta
LKLGKLIKNNYLSFESFLIYTKMSKNYSITDESHLATLDAHLKDNVYVGGNFPNIDDALVFEQFLNSKSEPNQEKHFNLWSWFNLICMYIPPIRESWKVTKQAGGKQEAPKKSSPKKETKKDDAPKADDDMDLFGSDTEEDRKKEEEFKRKAEAAKKDKKSKPALIAKSIIIMDVKIWDMEVTNLDDLAKRILAIEKDGLTWKTEYRLDDVAFGVKKIVIGCVIEDDKVSIDDVIDEIQGWEDDVQSVDIVTFNKI